MNGVQEKNNTVKCCKSYLMSHIYHSHSVPHTVLSVIKQKHSWFIVSITEDGTANVLCTFYISMIDYGCLFPLSWKCSNNNSEKCSGYLNVAHNTAAYVYTTTQKFKKIHGNQKKLYDIVKWIHVNIKKKKNLSTETCVHCLVLEFILYSTHSSKQHQW